MKKMLAVAAALSLSMVGVAFADDQTVPGTPGDPNCRDQTVAYIEQLAKNNDLDGFRGIGGYGQLNDLSNKQIMAIVRAHCGE